MFGFLKKLFAPKPVASTPPLPETPASTTQVAAPIARDDDLLINVYCSVATLPSIDFPHVIQARRDASNPALSGHLRGFSGWVQSLSNGAMTTTRYHVLRHLQKVQHHASLLVNPADMTAFSAWALAANAITFLPNGLICDPSGAVLLSPDGDQDDPAAAVPYPSSAHQRKSHTEDFLINRQLKSAASLPPVIAESEVILRSTAAVAERIMALFAVSVRAESVASRSPMASDEILQRLGLSDTVLTTAERAFITDRMPTPADTVKFAWCYECCHTLAWAVGIIEKLPFPGAICDVELIAQKLLKLGMGGIGEKAVLRPAAQILDALDLHQRLHWITRQAQVDKKAVPAGLEAGVILERHRALNWLVQFEAAEWDDVDTPT